MKFFRSKYLDPDDVLRDAAGPSPWYLRAFPAKLEGFILEDVGDSDPSEGMILLKNLREEIVAIFNMYCYVLPIGVDRLLVWYQPYRRRNGEYMHSNSIEFVVLYPNQLSAIADVQKTLEQIASQKLYVFTESELIEFRISSNVNAGVYKARFASELLEIEELLILGKGIPAEEAKTQINLCIFRLMPLKGLYEVIPQDWFNNGDLDYGYQWVTRVAREPKSGKIYGEGFRISSFVLDDSNRQVEKWFHKNR